ncbi:hypothetical protein LX36DRAFT_20926 [Colletotrichum falcatum]|nr:hypothetical protein LX36DRAFT_20926 [Colletotrichum falcatum]
MFSSIISFPSASRRGPEPSGHHRFLLSYTKSFDLLQGSGPDRRNCNNLVTTTTAPETRQHSVGTSLCQWTGSVTSAPESRQVSQYTKRSSVHVVEEPVSIFSKAADTLRLLLLTADCATRKNKSRPFSPRKEPWLFLEVSISERPGNDTDGGEAIG